MILYPAIDLKDGRCVRLVHGDMATATVFNDDPAAQARLFESQGFEWLHIVDLNGAFDGAPVNGAAVTDILGAISLPVQLGGGIRDMQAAAAWIEAGVARLVLGTAAVRDPAFVREAARAFPGQVAVGLDGRDGKVAVSGWAETTALDVVDVARRFEDAGVAALVFTDIARDGGKTGVNVEATAALAEKISLPVIASGGVRSLDDFKALIAARVPNLNGVICGRALYDGSLDAKAALGFFKAAARC